MNGFLIATAYSNTTGKLRKILFGYAVINTIAYSIVVLYGALVPIQFLVSFEFFVPVPDKVCNLNRYRLLQLNFYRKVCYLDLRESRVDECFELALYNFCRGF